MTKFEELMDIISKKKNNSANYSKVKTSDDDNNNEGLEVAGSESSKTPLLSTGDDETDPDLIDQLYRSNRNRVPRGEGASAWDTEK